MDIIADVLEIDDHEIIRLGLVDKTFEDLGISESEDDESSSDIGDDNFKPDLNKESKKGIVKKIDNFEINSLLDNDVSYSDAPNNFLFQHPFSLGLIGCKGSGKSTFLGNILQLYKDFFDDIYVFSPTSKLDPTFKQIIKIMNIPKSHLIKNFTNIKLKKLFNKISKVNKTKKQQDKVKVLIIFDDVVSQLNERKCSELIKLAFNHRHFSVSYVITSQTFKSVFKKMRANFSGWSFWRADNRAELKDIVEEISGMFPKKEFLKLFINVTNEKYKALCVNYQRLNQPEFMSINFQRSINTPSIENDINLWN